jgi:hypothetical protein
MSRGEPGELHLCHQPSTAHAQFTVDLKHGVVADLPAAAKVIVDPAERRRALAAVVEEFNRQNGADSPSPTAVLDEWVEHRPLANVPRVMSSPRSAAASRALRCSAFMEVL